jgi:transposase
MSAKERKRLLVFDRVRERQMSLRDAAGRLEISYRQCCRSYRGYREEGARGLLHRSRSRRSNRAEPEEFRVEAVKRYEEKYKGYGPTLATERPAEEGLVLDH